MTDKENVQVSVQTLNWGPCVTRLKITDEFKNLLLTEAKREKIDFRTKLAGQIEHENGYSEKSKTILTPHIAQCLGIYDHAYQKFSGKQYDKAPEYVMTALWINYQKQYEFNPPHDHDGTLSFVIYLSMPDKLIEENKKYLGKSCGPGGIQFLYGDGPRNCVSYQAYFPQENDMFIFPAWLKHYVSPFKSDCTRISVSGNVHSEVPINNIQQFAKGYDPEKSKHSAKKGVYVKE